MKSLRKIIDMTIVNVARKILPKRVRNLFNAIKQQVINRCRLLGILYSIVVYGIRPKLGSEGKLVMERNGVRIEYFSLGCLAFKEVFIENVYGQVFTVGLGNIVIDVGAAVGDFTIKAAREAGDRGKVVAIEAEPRNVALLRYNVETNGLSHNVEIVPKACGNRKGKARLYLSDAMGGHSIGKISNKFIDVDMDSLDNIANELGLTHVDFLKIDAESAELEILKGAERLLSLSTIKLAIAAYHQLPDSTPEISHIISYLTAKGSKIYTRDNAYIHATRVVREGKEE